MSEVRNKKMDLALDQLLNRQDYLVTQANDLAKAFGNLTTFEHKILDYCFSFVEKDDTVDKVYKLTSKEILHHFGLNASGKNYLRVIQAFKALNENTAIYMRVTRQDKKKAIMMTSLLNHITVIEDGEIEFSFNSKVAPYVFDLKEQFYSFKLAELARIRSKYTLALLKIWNATVMGKWKDYYDPNSLPPNVIIQGTLDEWESWLLGTDKNGKPKKWSAGRFKQMVLDVALEELGRLYPKSNMILTTLKKGRKVVGYHLDITQIKFF